LYTDGQLLIQNPNYKTSGNWFLQTVLTPQQICSLLASIERTGFFGMKGDGSLFYDDPIYVLDDSVPRGAGAPEYIIQINGEKRRYVTIYAPYEPYVIRELKDTLQLLRNYTPPAPMTPYRAKYLVLWIEKGREVPLFRTPTPTPRAWPAEFPALEDLLANRDEGEAFVEGKFVAPMLDLFSNRPGEIAFDVNEQTFWERTCRVIARPLLPHESQNSFSAFPYKTTEFKLPFTCGN
jgi:hypothetical protein